VVHFAKDASQTRDYGVASPRHIARLAQIPSPSAQGRVFAAQKKLAQDDKQTSALPKTKMQAGLAPAPLYVVQVQK
jgi:hypothetical protein